jgi:type III secretion protein L
MTFLLLHRDAQLALHSDGLVVGAQHSRALADALDAARALAQLRDSEAERLAAAQQAAEAAGHAAGLRQGRREAADAAARPLAHTLQTLAAQARSQQAALREAVPALALLVLRRLAATLPRDEVLVALLRQALDQIGAELAPAGGARGGACVVHLHPDLLEPVRAQLDGDDAVGLSIEWRADATLAPLDCHIDLPAGRLLAGLEAQLAQVQAALREARVHGATPADGALAT